MAWKDRLRPASFKQAAFGVEAHSSEQGRRVVVHEYPGRDKPYVEDLGAKARGFTLRGFVVGKDYQQARDALLDAANAPGPGQLVHPYFGTLRVVCTAVSVSESGEAGGMAVFNLTFVEAGESRYPAAESDPAGSLLDAADTLDGQLAEAFGKWFDLDGLPDFLSRDNLQALTERIQRLTTVGGLLDLTKQSPFLRQVRQLLDAVGELSATPAVLGSRIIGLFTDLTGSFSQPLGGIMGLARAFRGGRREVSRGLPANPTPYQRAESNRQAVQVLFEAAALNAAAATAVVRPDDITIELPQPGGNFGSGGNQQPSRIAPKAAAAPLFESLDEAVALRRLLLAWLDELAPQLPDSAFSAAQDLRAAIVQALPDTENELPRLVDYTPQRPLPVVVLAYRLHGDARRSSEILRHNPVAHPGFMPVRPLRVLSD